MQLPVPILVVDDERRTCEMIEEVLTREGYSVDVALDAKSALDLVAEREYAIAVLDYRLPDMDGVELFRRIHRQQPDAIGLFLTGYATIDTIFPAISAGVCRVLAKPLHADELVSTISDCLMGVVD